jgi:energy-converting hydrogenase A subunit R
MRRILISDCEGPISKNDNAFEATSHFIPNGNKIFMTISKYDDVLADVLSKPNHEAGATLKLVLPFLKAYSVTDRKMLEFSAETLILIPNAKKTLQHVRSLTQVFIISTSYEHYAKALCNAIGFPFKNMYCTRVNIDKYDMAKSEIAELKQIAQEIGRMPSIEVPPDATSLEDLSAKTQTTIKKLDVMFHKEIPRGESGKIYSEVTPVGGNKKAEAIQDVVNELNMTLADVMYVGDSITDEKALKLVRENGGLSVSFNGNRYAIRNAEIAVLSETSTVISIIAEVFVKFGKNQVLDLIKRWEHETLEKSLTSRVAIDDLLKEHPSKLPKVEAITSENIDALSTESSKFRNKFRGKTIGSLG